MIVPLEQTLGTFDELVTAGKVRYVAASNFSADRLAESLELSRSHHWTEYVAVETHYNLASARTVEQLDELMAFVDVELEPGERAFLDETSGRAQTGAV